MHKSMTETIHHLSQSYAQLARILEANKQATVRASELVCGIPDAHAGLGGTEEVLNGASQVTKSVIAYLNGLAELEDSLAVSLFNVVKAASEGVDEE
ncbi:nucleoside-diphosphate sugar epimerase [Cohnella candidum]|uniref:Nucleoside-diphosphate sugar epimerase n=1 Tax=Cohnella candidum TaxID=2674991 RepID=A0A3G3JTB4_9BACL|nr:nucleoside-diphosphate sugar epimerase [Cohnella candidum]AYQ71434.1 nucleoside-diphosphate sugar epimerase [Cohnella candidum]